MEYKKLTMGGYNLHLIRTDKFKVNHIEVIFHNNIDVKVKNEGSIEGEINEIQ